MQSLDLETEFPDLPLSLITLSQLADVMAKPLQLDQDFLIAATELTRRRRRHVAAIANFLLETRDVSSQGVDRLPQLQA